MTWRAISARLYLEKHSAAGSSSTTAAADTTASAAAAFSTPERKKQKQTTERFKTGAFNTYFKNRLPHLTQQTRVKKCVG